MHRVSAVCVYVCVFLCVRRCVQVAGLLRVPVCCMPRIPR